MKKTLIAVAGASVAAAAMPVMGVFAATTTTSFTDVVTVNVGKSCTIIPSGGTVIEQDTTTDGNRTVKLQDRNFGPYTLMQGHYISNIGGPQIAEDKDDPADPEGSNPASAATIVCSANTGDEEPGSGETQAAGSWVLTAQGAAGETAMKGTGENQIPTGTWTTGASVWQYKVVGSSSAANYGEIPATAARIAESTTSGGTVTISPRYRVSAAANLAQDTYVGKVTYTLIYANE